MTTNHRQDALTALRNGNQHFDLVIIGGGITGAGIAREAAGSGLRTLLVEQRDFAWGTSSRSSKMVHGGLRYLGSGQPGLTRDAVSERQRLMSEVPGLVDPLRFIMPHYHRQFPGPRLFQLLLRVYDWLAGQRGRLLLTAGEVNQWVPGLSTTGLTGASGFADAVTDDARLVQRIIEQARREGATCLNYVQAMEILRDNSGKVTGLVLEDAAAAESGAGTPERLEVPAAAIINATGAWADRLRPDEAKAGGQEHHIRPLRGSHLVVPFDSLPVSCSVSLLHPRDRRPVFAFPWQGVTILGTTDLDHDSGLERDPAITDAEVDYLIEIAGTLFPDRKLDRTHILSTWAGVRPVVSGGKDKAPSRENREHVFWQDQGLISIAGGKLTTFRRIAREALAMARPWLPEFQLRSDSDPVFTGAPPVARPQRTPHMLWQRLSGWYGPNLGQVIAAGTLDQIPGTEFTWAELNWAAEYADVVHLDDLMLRRTRLGLVLPEGGKALLPAIRERCLAALGWSDERWQEEVHRYDQIWRQSYSLPTVESGVTS